MQHLSLACKVITEKTNEIAILKAEKERKDSLMVAVTSRVEQLESKLSLQMTTFEHRFRKLEETVHTSTRPDRSHEVLKTHLLSLERACTTNEINVNAAQRQLTEIRSDAQKLSQQARDATALSDSHGLRLLGLETAAYNGVMIWKVHFDQAIADAKRRNKVHLNSPYPASPKSDHVRNWE